MLAIFQRFLGARMRIHVEYVDEIPMVRTGKRLVAVSKLKIDLQGDGSGSQGAHHVPSTDELDQQVSAEPGPAKPSSKTSRHNLN